MQDWINDLIDFFRTNEPFLSGLGNFIAVLTAVIGVLGFMFGWWKRLYQRLLRKVRGRAVEQPSPFPFQVISSPKQLKERLLPDPEQRVIPDRGIKYIPGRAEDLDTLFEKHGRVLIKGRSKAGKTREMAELISRRWHAGLNVLFLQPNAWLKAPFVVPQELPYRNVVLVINDVDHYCAFDRPLTPGEDETLSIRYDSFPQRLQQAIEHFEKICASPSEVRVVATVRREPEFWDKIRFDAQSLPWSSFKVFELDDVPTTVATALVDQLSQMTGIRVTDNAKIEMAARNDGTFLNIILAFRDWCRSGEALVDASQIKAFEGELANTWQRRYERAVVANPTNRYIYAAIDILRRVNLVPHRYLVAELASRFEGSATAKLSRTLQAQSRRLFERSRLAILRSKIGKRIGDRFPAIGRWFSQLGESRLGKAVGRYLLYWSEDLAPKGGSARIQQSLQRLVETEIPIQNDILVPYDGQVDGRGDEWLSSGIVSDLLAERASSDEHFVFSLVSLADRFSKDHNYQAALRMLNSAVQIAPSYAFARRDRAWIYRVMKQYDAALSDIDMWMQLEPSDHVAYAHKALVFKWMRKYDEASALMDQAISMRPAQGWLYAWKGDLLRDQGRLDEAHAIYDKALSIDPKRHWTYGAKAIALRYQGKNDKALGLIEKGIDLKPDEDWLWGHRGITLRLMERHNEALTAFEKAIELDSKADWLYTERGITLREMERYHEALEWIDKGLELDPSDARNHGQRGVTLRLMERYDEALAAFDKAIELDPKWTGPLGEKALTFRRLQRYDEALTSLEQVTTLIPKVAWPVGHQGITLRLMERYDEALVAFDEAIELDPKADWLYMQRGITLREIEHYDEALEWIAKGIETDPSDAWNHHQQGITLREMERYDEALAAFDKAIELKPDSDWYLYNRALMHQTMGQGDNAQADLAAAIQRARGEYERDPKKWSNTFNLALYQLATGETDEAERYYRETLSSGAPLHNIRDAIRDLDDLLDLFPDHPQGRAIRDFLSTLSGV